jgi:hypothetical protein
MDKQNEIRKTKLLLVEGNHERDVFGAWLKALKLDDIQVMPIAGKTRLRDNLRLLVNQSAFPDVVSLVVVRDADDNPAAAFVSVRDALTNAGLTPPKQAWLLTDETTPHTGIVIVPRADRQGALEELLLATVADDPLAAPVRAFIESAVETLTQSGHRLPPPSHRRGKAEIHAFLATCEEPDRDPGKAALAGVWRFDHEALQALAGLLAAM